MTPVSAENVSLESLIAELADQFIQGLERGEQPDIEAIAAEHPECATVIRQVLSSLDLMRFATPAVQSANATGDVIPAGVLGDFRVVREIGRGGMGIVYEATQISLDRRVALKVLPFAAALDPRHLQRFKNEAQAAAHLHHQNIVPVYSVGCERGVHYYAMQFIEGRTVASMIQAAVGQKADSAHGQESGDLVHSVVARSPEDVVAPRLGRADRAIRPATGQAETLQAHSASTERSGQRASYFRSVARLAQQAASALDHAHQLGIIHRDIKPANLLVDLRGNLWITDFGLARLTNDAGLTMTGDVIGTLRYMSPEQALGQGTPLDHRTDIYSLGITLYELVTLEPAFPGTDRAGLARRIIDLEPRRPRQINRAVPPELETIVQKATAKSPTDRYRSAGELADDLGRYLLDQPIHARRPSLWQRTRSWSRRHRSLVWSLTASLALALTSAVVILAISNVRIGREKLLTADALARAEANYRSTEKERRRAESNFSRALAAVDAMVSRAQTRSSGPAAGQDENLRRGMLADALKFCRQIVDEEPSTKTGPYEIGWAYYHMGSIYALLGQDAQAGAAWQEALSRLERVVAASPQVTEYQSSLASCCTALGEWLRQTSADYDRAEGYLTRAQSLQEALVAQDPDHVQYRRDLAGTEHGLGYLYSATGRLKECRQAYDRALSLLANVQTTTGDRGIAIERAKINNSLGVALRMSGHAALAEECHRQALAWIQSAASAGPAGPVLDPEAWRAQFHLALALAQQRHTAQALVEMRQALAGKEQCRAKGAEDRGLRQDIALNMSSLAALLESEGLTSEAEQWYRRGLSELESLSREFPEAAEFARSHALVASQLAPFLWQRGLRTQADQFFGQAIAAYDRALAITPANAQIQNNLAWLLATCPAAGRRNPERAVTLAQAALQNAPQQGAYWNTLGVAQYRAGDNAQAIASLEKSVALRSGGDPYDWLFLALSHHRAGNMREAARWYMKAARVLHGRARKNAELSRLRAEADRAFQL